MRLQSGKIVELYDLCIIRPCAGLVEWKGRNWQKVCWGGRGEEEVEMGGGVGIYATQK